MAPIPGAVARAAVGFGLDPERMRPLGGASGAAWSDGDVVLRVGERVGDEVLAASAAADRLPVPRVLGRLELDGICAVLLERVPGRSAGELAMENPGRAAAVGRACGELHDALAEVACPPGLRDAPGANGSDRRLLHLDLHPFNVVVDDDGEPTGVIDWANAAAGDPELDRARTWSVLTLDPAARELAGDPGWAALTDHWLEAGRMHDLSASARIWACKFMLEDLAERYTRTELAHVRDAMRLADTRSAREHEVG
jgi:aminoglycoside phosphotransferase (APT) family kinase protein